jgi:hypothetical protein
LCCKNEDNAVLVGHGNAKADIVMQFSKRGGKTVALLAMLLITGIASESNWARQTQGPDVAAPVPENPTNRQAARSLLESGWEKNQSNREMSLDDFPAQAADPQFLLAFTLNRMQHRRYTEALSTATRLTGISPETLEGWILRMWLETLSDHYEPALAAMQSFKSTWEKAGQLDDKTTNDMLSQLGRLIGYLQGPVGTKVNPAMLNATIVSITNGLDQDQMATFNKSREAVLTQFEDLLKSHQQKITDEEQKVAQSNVLETQDINNQNVLMDQRANDLQQAIDAVEQEGYDRLDRIRAEIEPLQREATIVNSQLDSSLFTLDAMFSEYYYYQQNFRRHPNLPYLSLRIRDQQVVVGSLRNQLRSINNQIYATEDRANQIQSEYENRISQMSGELESMGVQRRRNSRRLVKLAAGPEVAGGKITALENRATALTTYDPFPLELARQQVLEQLK